MRKSSNKGIYIAVVVIVGVVLLIVSVLLKNTKEFSQYTVINKDDYIKCMISLGLSPTEDFIQMEGLAETCCYGDVSDAFEWILASNISDASGFYNKLTTTYEERCQSHASSSIGTVQIWYGKAHDTQFAIAMCDNLILAGMCDSRNAVDTIKSLLTATEVEKMTASVSDDDLSNVESSIPSEESESVIEQENDEIITSEDDSDSSYTSDDDYESENNSDSDLIADYSDEYASISTGFNDYGDLPASVPDGSFSYSIGNVSLTFGTINGVDPDLDSENPFYYSYEPSLSVYYTDSVSMDYTEENIFDYLKRDDPSAAYYKASVNGKQVYFMTFTDPSGEINVNALEDVGGDNYMYINASGEYTLDELLKMIFK